MNCHSPLGWPGPARGLCCFMSAEVGCLGSHRGHRIQTAPWPRGGHGCQAGRGWDVGTAGPLRGVPGPLCPCDSPTCFLWQRRQRLTWLLGLRTDSGPRHSCLLGVGRGCGSLGAGLSTLVAQRGASCPHPRSGFRAAGVRVSRGRPRGSRGLTPRPLAQRRRDGLTHPSLHPQLLVSSALCPVTLSTGDILWVTSLLPEVHIPCEFCLRLTNYLLASCLY